MSNNSSSVRRRAFTATTKKSRLRKMTKSSSRFRRMPRPKRRGELLCHTYSHLYDIRTVCLRFFTVYGARQRPDLAIRKFSQLITENKPIQMFGDGTTRRDYTYIDDIIQGVRAAIDYDKTPHEIFNLGESDTVELRYLIELLEKNLDQKATIDRRPMQAGDVSQTFADISKARRLLNYDPQTKIEDGIKKFVEMVSFNVIFPRLKIKAFYRKRASGF